MKICTQKDRSLKLRSNFLHTCKPLGTIIQFIIFYKPAHLNLTCSPLKNSFRVSSLSSVDSLEALLLRSSHR